MDLFEYSAHEHSRSQASKARDEGRTERADKATQLRWVAAQLKAGRRITPLEALSECGCFRLGARVYDLRKDGWEIETDMQKGYATYFLKGEGK